MEEVNCNNPLFLLSISKLQLTEDEDGKQTKIAHSMVAKDGEVITNMEYKFKKYIMKYIFKNVKYKGGEIHQRLPLHGASGRLAESSHVLNERDNQVAAVSFNTSQQILFSHEQAYTHP